MKKSLFLLFALAVFVFGCGGNKALPAREVDQSALGEDISAEIELLSESDNMVDADTTADEYSFEASFMSDNQTFSYEIHYDGDLLELVDTPFPGAGVFGPSFQVDGGAELIGFSVLLDDLGDIEKGSTLTSFKNFDVYERTENILGCSVHKGIIPFGTEALVIQTKTCAGQDEVLADEAFFDIVSDLKFYAR